MEELEDVRLIVHRGELYLQFVGSMRTFDKDGKPERNLEGRQWLGRLERTPQVRACSALCCRSELRACRGTGSGRGYEAARSPAVGAM